MQDQISAAVLFLAKLIERSNTNCANFNADQLEMFKTKLAELLNDRFANHWFPEAPNRGQGYRCIRLNKNVKKDQILEHAAKASGMSYEDMRLPVELTLWVDPHEVCCRFGESKGSYCTLASFNDKENQEIFISDELFNKAANFHSNSYQYNNGGRRHQTGAGHGYHRNRKTSEHSSGSSSDEKMNSPLKQRPIQSNINSPNSRRQLTASNINNKNQKSPNLNQQSHHKSKMSLNNVSPQQNQQYHNQSMGQSWFNMAPPQQPWMPTSMSTSPPSSGQYSSMRQKNWMPPAVNYYNQSTNYNNRSTNYFNKPTVKV